MKNALIFMVLTLINANFALADGDGHGSATDLIAPLVNILILGGFLVFKLKKPLSDYFTKQADEIANTLERASLKSKEAEVMLQAQMKKMSNLEIEAKDVIKQAEAEVKNFEKVYSREIEDKCSKLKSDATAKIEAEKKALVNALNATLLDEVIAKAKHTIKTNKAQQAQVSSKMLGEMMK
jgi:F0F1-type ATP synthase membrane subunit b/b'